MQDYVYYFLILFCYFLLFLLNLTKFIFGGDSAEISTASLTFGIAHPPGYPFLIFLNNIFVRLFPSFVNVQQKLSLLNSFFILISAILIFNLLKKLKVSSFFSLITTIFFLSLYPIWLYGLVPEVFSLAILLITLQIYSLLSLYLTKEKKYKYFFLLALSLSIAHHHIFVIFIPGYIWLILKSKLKNFFIKNSWLEFFFILIGPVFYLYPVVVSILKTPLDIENAQTIEGLIRLITRASYGTFKAFAGSSSNFFNRIYGVFSLFVFLIHDFKPLGIIFIISGAIYLFNKNQILFKFLTLNLISSTIFFFYSNFFIGYVFGLATYERFLTFLYIILIFYFSFGLIFFNNLINKLLNQFLFFKKNLINFIKFAYFFLLIFFISISIIYNYQRIKYLKNLDLFYNFALDIINTPSKNSILILTTDNSFFLTQYLYYGEKKRNDLSLLTLGYLGRSHLYSRKGLNAKISFPNKKTIDPLYYFLKKNESKFEIFSDTPLEKGFWAPYGILWKYISSDNYENQKKKIIEINEHLWNNYRYPQLNLHVKDILFTQDIVNFYNRQIWALINFLIVNKEINLAQKYAQKYFYNLKNDYYFALTYLNLNIYKKNCNKNLNNVVNFLLKEKIKSSDDYLPLINYYKICQNNPKQLKKIMNDYKKLKADEEISLKKL